MGRLSATETATPLPSPLGYAVVVTPPSEVAGGSQWRVIREARELGMRAEPEGTSAVLRFPEGSVAESSAKAHAELARCLRILGWAARATVVRRQWRQ